ncbi:hypothetical protein ACS0TY_010498 [Phlomoides rotata]
MMPIKRHTTPLRKTHKYRSHNILKMAGHSLPAAACLLILSLSLFISSSSEACGIKIYWGQNGNELSIKNACDTGYYKYLSIAFLIDFGCDRTPVMNLAGHCDPSSGTCTSLSSDVAYCQSKGIQVFISLGGAVGQHSICSPQDAQKVADYLWNTFLAGTGSGPLGQVALDGVDFDIEASLSNLYWEDLAKALAGYSTSERKVYLSAAPQCFFPDYYLDTALRTGLFDYVWVQFYNNPPCDIRSGVSGLLASWNQWSAYLAQFSAETQLFMGLPASPNAAGGGYIEPDQLVRDILPVIRKTTNYGGLMLWSRYFDLLNAYSPRVVVPACSDPPATTLSHQDLLISQVV